MKIQRGDYDGASRFAYFDRDIHSMNLDECRRLLQCILWQAMPCETHADEVYNALQVAERVCKEQEPA